METKQTFIAFILLLYSSVLFSQSFENDSAKKDSVISSVSDSVNPYHQEMKVIVLNEVMVFNRPEFSTWDERKAYYILRRRTLKVYPYAVLAAKRLTQLDERLSNIEGKQAQKKYTSIIESYIQNEFGPTLKKFTQSEGRILIKLIYRQTGKTAFDIVKDYRSGWKAFWSNATANMFNLSLKADYNPFKYKDDLAIESVLQEAFNSGSLEFTQAFWAELDIYDPYFDPLPVAEKK